MNLKNLCRKDRDFSVIRNQVTQEAGDMYSGGPMISPTYFSTNLITQQYLYLFITS